MITVNIKGGLGNQMFQYACGRALALRNGENLRLAFSQYQADMDRPFSLAAFNIAGEIVSANEISPFTRFWSRLRQKITGNFNVDFDPGILKKRGVYLDGYFQSEKYFLDQAETIRKDLTLKEPFRSAAASAAALITSDQTSVSLHVRRGDYISHPDFSGIADARYYERAIAYINQQVPNAHFFIFSDDISLCRDNLPLPAATFVSQPELKDHEELVLMSLCRHHIIANSSFSWWAAWLGRHSNQLVVAPARWANRHEGWYQDIIPTSWIRL